MTIAFRPHHFLCALCFQGRGYSHAFVANFQAIMETLRSSHGGEMPIHVVSHTDSICEPCPHRVNQSCTTEEKITVLDRAHAGALQISGGDTLTWNEAKEKIADHISLDTFHRICATCSWKASGICEKALTQFLDGP